MPKQRRPADDPNTPFVLEEQAGPRTARLEHLIFEEIDRLFRLEVNDPRLQGVSAVSVQLSPDLRNAKVMYALRDELPGKERGGREKRVLEGLQKVTPFLRARVADALSMRRTPDLHFHRDRLAEASLRAAAVLAAASAAGPVPSGAKAEAAPGEAGGAPAGEVSEGQHG